MTDLRLPDDLGIVVIGCGQMGSALAEGLVDSGRVAPERLACVDRDAERAEGLADDIGARAVAPEAAFDVFRGGNGPIESRIYVAAVKPKDVADALMPGRKHFEATDTILSIAAGVSMTRLRDCVGRRPALVRAMPNTPALIGRGITGVLGDDEADMETIEALLEGVGRVVHLDDETDFDALTALSGSGPAYVFTALEALADGAVAEGLDRSTAIELATETLLGSAALAREDEAHTAELKDRVTSPGGTTAAGLTELESNGFRSALIEAVRAAAERGRQMGDSE
jgi:pyrroline-5-carboxylate reductase